MYIISTESKKIAKRLNVIIKPSIQIGKKIDVFDTKMNKICSIGDINYNDFHTYSKTKGIFFANERKRLYHIRHKKDADKKNSPGYYSSLLLW